MGLIFMPMMFIAQQENNELDDYEKVKQTILTWADSTFYDYDEPRFEHYRANYTDEYLIASLRVKSIDRSIRDLKKSYSSGYYKETDESYNSALEDLESRKKEAVLNNIDFQPKVVTFQVVFWANIKLDSGIYNYIKQDIVLDNEFNVIENKIAGSIGDNKNAAIIYR